MKTLALSILVLSLVACRSTRPIQTAISKKDSAAVSTIPDTKKDSIAFIQNALQKLDSNKLDFKTFAGKVNVDYTGGDGKKYDLNANVRMYKDSAIWISVNAILGIEALRVLVTKDSVKLLDKQNKKYTARTVDYLQDVTALPLNLKILQDLLIGNPVFLDSNVISYSQAPGTISLTSVGHWFKNLLTVSDNDKLLQRSKLDDVDLSRSRTADLTYSDYADKNSVLFATKRKITVVEKKKLDIKLDFKQYDFNGDVSFPFSIPKNYSSN